MKYLRSLGGRRSSPCYQGNAGNVKAPPGRTSTRLSSVRRGSTRDARQSALGRSLCEQRLTLRAEMTYFLDLFSPETYEAFSRSDRSVSGFRPRQRIAASRVCPG